MTAPDKAQGWDCHAHVFGPYARYPLAADRSYTPPEATAAHYLDALERLSLSHGVLVQPSAYGTDHGLLLDTLAGHKRLRGVVVVQADTRLNFARLHDGGVRAARFSHRSGTGANFAGSASVDDLFALAPALADAGLHAELWTDCRALQDLAPRLSALPVPVVIDHMGSFDVAAGVGQDGFRSLLALLDGGRIWVKLCVYRNLLGLADPDAGRPFHEALLAAHPQRLVWGSDWPHLRVSPVPATTDLLQTFMRWTSDEQLVAQILQHNPARLYG